MIGLPARIGKPERMVGLTDQISSPAYATSIGLLDWGILFSETTQIAIDGSGNSHRTNNKAKADGIMQWLKRMLP